MAARETGLARNLSMAKDEGSSPGAVAQTFRSARVIPPAPFRKWHGSERSEVRDEAIVPPCREAQDGGNTAVMMAVLPIAGIEVRGGFED